MTRYMLPFVLLAAVIGVCIGLAATGVIKAFNSVESICSSVKEQAGSDSTKLAELNALITSVKEQAGSDSTKLGWYPVPQLAALPEAIAKQECTGADGCSGHGSCDLSTKICKCSPGFGGQQCEFGAGSLFWEHDAWQDVKDHPHELLPLDDQGWNAVQPTYAKVMTLTPMRLVVEVGVWKGASSIIFANLLKQRNSGALLSVDTFTGAPEFWNRRSSEGRYDSERDLLFKFGLPRIGLQFVSNCFHTQVTDYVIPFQVGSRLAAKILSEGNVFADFIHIDAAHEYQDVCEDIVMWWPLLAPGGVLMGDDYFPPDWPGVVKAVDEFASKIGLERHIEGVKWWVIKPK